MSVQVLNKQRLVDLVIQEYGDTNSLFDVAGPLDISITDELEGVAVLDLPVLELTGKARSITTVLKRSLNLVASADDNEFNIAIPPAGIGYMKITDESAPPETNDFIVS